MGSRGAPSGWKRRRSLMRTGPRLTMPAPLSMPAAPPDSDTLGVGRGLESDGHASYDGAMSSPRVVRAPRGSEKSCKGWVQEAALRMLMNNLDPDVAENPDKLIVYGGTGRAARSWEAFDAIVRSLRALENDETWLV